MCSQEVVPTNLIGYSHDQLLMAGNKEAGGRKKIILRSIIIEKDGNPDVDWEYHVFDGNIPHVVPGKSYNCAIKLYNSY